MCGVCDMRIFRDHFSMCEDDLAGGGRSSYAPDDEKIRWDYYTVTLDKGRISYSPVICGDCLIELEQCGHGYDLRRKQKTGRK
jgi:hypothetical protein